MPNAKPSKILPKDIDVGCQFLDHTLNISSLGRSPGLAVLGGASYSRGGGFNALDG